jgi:hypothetical protein
MISKLKKYGINHLWHFTDKSNLNSIVEKEGILSLAKIFEENVAVSAFGGNQWSHDADRQKNLDRFVNLTFLDDHPMLYRAKQEGRIQEPIWLQIDIDILLLPGTMYSLDVSNKSGVPIVNGDTAKDQLDFEVLFTYMDWRDSEVQQRRQTALKAEILIPDIVPLNMIKGWKNG